MAEFSELVRIEINKGVDLARESGVVCGYPQNIVITPVTRCN